MRASAVPLVLLLGAFARPAAAGEEAADAPLVPARWLVLESPDLRVRRPVGPSAVFERHLLRRDAAPPKEGDALTGERGVEVRWTAREAKDGTLDGAGAAWAFTTVESPSDRVVLARVTGAATLWVNGEPFVGDVYGYGFGGVPVPLRKGTNALYLSGLRGVAAVQLLPTTESVRLALDDTTRPDFAGEAETHVGQVVVNATRGTVEADVSWDETRRVRLLPCSVAKVPLRGTPAAQDRAGIAGVTLVGRKGEGGGFRGIALTGPESGRPRRVTRVSEIDGSVQEYAVVEPAPSLVAAPTRVVLSLHGASVDCLAQARSYSRRPGFWIVCPTNRRPFGFDWQDWGRRDAYEALGHFGSAFGADVSRVCLTGHSMGGHGTWHLAANDPDRFAAIAPSAGWCSFDTYPEPRPASPLSPLWRRADGQSDTLALVGNLAPLPTYVVHGTKDDNVPPQQAELMLKALRAAGGTPQAHFQEGGEHWWDGDAAPGADCVDWPGIFDLFAQADPRKVHPSTFDWSTIDPSIDAEHHWVGAEIALVQGMPIRIRAAWDVEAGRATLTTENALRISVAPYEARERWDVVLDGVTFHASGPRAWFERSSDGWTAVPNLPDERKRPGRTGPLKNAFARRFAMVVPTQGDEAETREAVARVRFDASQWWYRGNGFADVALDTEVLADPERFELRNLVLYGNADTNAAWTKVVGESPVDVRRGKVRVGKKEAAADDAACFFVRPRADDAKGLVACLGDTGPLGCRLAMTHAVFISGAGYPDHLAWDARALKVGDGGVLAAGWFDAEWKLDGREHRAGALREEAR